MVASYLTDPNISIIPSTSPMQDAETVLKLFSDLYQLESSADESVVLTSTTSSSTSLIFLHAANASSVIPLIASKEQIETARELCDDPKDVQVNSRLGDCRLSLIQLKGGSSLLLTPSSLAATRHGRVLLTRALIKSTGGDTSTKETDSEETDSGDGGFDDIQIERESPVEASNGGAIMQEQEYPLAKFPSLAVSVLEENDKIANGFPINSQEPIPVETDLFKGRMLMLVKPVHAEDDPYWTERLFSKKKRRFIFKLQGKFKRVPEGTLYAGGEISNPMQLGLVSKGICGLLLKFIKSVAPDIHYSFGDSKEKAHIVVPAWSFFERLVVTKPGEELPEMDSGEEFYEPIESVQARNSGKSKANWNTEDTYSMSFYTMYLDVAKWQVVQVPVTRDMNLKTFWANSFLRIVLFENTTPVKDGRHLQLDNTYYFAVELRHLSVTPRNEEEEEETPLPWEKRKSGTFRVLKDSGRQDSGSLLAESYEDDQFFDAEEENSTHEIDAESMHIDLNSRSRPSVDLLSKIDTTCPAMVEIAYKGKYTKTYAFNLEKTGATVFRTASSVEEYFAISSAKQAAEQTWSPRLSSSERCRRILGQTISEALLDGSSSGIARLSKLARKDTAFDSTFLQRAEPSWTRKQKLKVRKCGYGARALSDRHWMEEWIQVSDRYILFHNPEKQKCHFRISLQSIVQVKLISEDDTPFMSPFSYISIGTLGRTIYVMFKSQVEAEDWVNLIVGLVAIRNSNDVPSPADYQSDSSVQTISFDDPSDEFLLESSMWNCKQRRILNGRQFVFHSRDSQTKSPTELMESALALAFEQSSDYDEQSLIAFLDSAAALNDVDVYELDEKERAAFFLNLYHTMIMHAFLVLGPPDNSFKWISYFNTIAYQCSDDIFSLTELEHCVIRAAMSYPSAFLTKFVLPKSTFSFALSRPDYRINFALNCGSLSNPEFVPVYKADTLNEQLDQASRMYMDYAARATSSARRAGAVTLVLPKICAWFADDFGNGSTNDVVECVERFLKGEQRKLVASCFWKSEKRYNFNDLNVKSAAYSFECRSLKLASEYP